jgi:hypothetical protein
MLESARSGTMRSAVGLTVLLALVTALVAVGDPARAAGAFVDDDGSVFEADIEALAAAGITYGCNPPEDDRFCPDDPVSRGQMAAFLVRALDLDGGDGDRFVDDDGSVFEADIEALAAAGITYGCNPPEDDRFCPGDPVTRGQMAAFLVRALPGLDPLPVPTTTPTTTSSTPTTTSTTPGPTVTTPPVESRGAFVEEDGRVAIEVESAYSIPNQWNDATASPYGVDGEKGRSALIWTGPNHYGSGGNGVLTYEVLVDTPGEYKVRIRSMRWSGGEDIARDLHNDVWFRADGGSWQKTFHQFTLDRWSYTRNWEASHDSFPALTVDLDSGLHTIQLSARSQYFVIDRIHLYLGDDSTNAELEDTAESPRLP